MLVRPATGVDREVGGSTVPKESVYLLRPSVPRRGPRRASLLRPTMALGRVGGSDVVMDAKLPVRLENVDRRPGRLPPRVDRVTEPDELSLSTSSSCRRIERRTCRPGASKVIDQIDEPEAALRIAEVVAKVFAAGPATCPCRLALRDDELFVRQQADVGVSHSIDAGAVAQAHEQGLAAELLRCRAGIGVGETPGSWACARSAATVRMSRSRTVRG